MIRQTTFRNMERSEALEKLVAEEAHKLERLFRRIVSCRVLIEQPHHRRGAPFHVRIDVGVPGDELVVSHVPAPLAPVEDEEEPRADAPAASEAAYKNAQRAIRDAFRKAERRVGDYAGRKIGK